MQINQAISIICLTGIKARLYKVRWMDLQVFWDRFLRKKTALQFFLIVCGMVVSIRPLLTRGLLRLVEPWRSIKDGRAATPTLSDRRITLDWIAKYNKLDKLVPAKCPLQLGKTARMLKRAEKAQHWYTACTGVFLSFLNVEVKLIALAYRKAHELISCKLLS